MQRHRVLFAFGIAWLSALLLSWWVYKRVTAPLKRETVQAVAASRDLPAGKRLASADLKLVVIDRKDLPQGAAFKTAELVDRSVAVAISAHELVLDRKLAGRGSGEGLTALIEPGMRAVSVQVNEMSGVAGFAQPGTRVDVLFTRIGANNDAATTTILQNVKVIAYGKQLEASARTDTRATPAQTVATLLVTQSDAEKLALAVQRGRIHLALRNPLDNSVESDSRPVRSSDLGMDDAAGRPRAAAARSVGSGLAAAKARPAVATQGATKGDKGGDKGGATPAKVQHNGSIVIKVFRGTKVSEEVFP